MAPLRKSSGWISSRFICLPRFTIHYRLLDEGLVSLTGIMVNSHRRFKILVPSESVLIRAYLSLVTVEGPHHPCNISASGR